LDNLLHPSSADGSSVSGTPSPGADTSGTPPPVTPPASVHIQTTTLPSAGLSSPYAASFTATGGAAPSTLAVANRSTLPPGLSLTSSGALVGTASSLGSYAFSVVVSDAASPTGTDSANYSIDVSTFHASISLLRYGEAWTGESYPLSATGGSGTTYDVLSNQ